MPDIFSYIDLSLTHKSKRNGIVNGILDAIDNKAVSKGDPLPSVNKFIQKLGVARMTVVKALNTLKDSGVVVSEDKVGYFVNDVNAKREMKVFLFLTGFYSYHEILYKHIVEGVKGQDITVDMYFHHCNPKIFKSILQENLGSYGLYVITGFEEGPVKQLLARIPKNKLLQIMRPPLLPRASSVSQDFYAGLKNSLGKLRNRLVRFNLFALVFPEGRGHPVVIKTAFTDFCKENDITYSIKNCINKDLDVKGVAFWVIEDDDLISLIKFGEKMGFRVGEEFGILSYNETSMKEIIRNGITVISVDFAKMGQSISRFIANPKHTVEIFEPEIIIRNSL